MRVKDLVRILNISPSYASDILKGKKGVSSENRNIICKYYPDTKFVMSNKPRFKIVVDKDSDKE